MFSDAWNALNSVQCALQSASTPSRSVEPLRPAHTCADLEIRLPAPSCPPGRGARPPCGRPHADHAPARSCGRPDRRSSAGGPRRCAGFGAARSSAQRTAVAHAQPHTRPELRQLAAREATTLSRRNLRETPAMITPNPLRPHPHFHPFSTHRPPLTAPRTPPTTRQPPHARIPAPRPPPRPPCSPSSPRPRRP